MDNDASQNNTRISSTNCMASDIAEILRRQIAYVSGGRDRSKRLLICIPQARNTSYDVEKDLRETLYFFIRNYRLENRLRVFSVLIDNRMNDVDWINTVIRVLQFMEDNISDVYILIPKCGGNKVMLVKKPATSVPPNLRFHFLTKTMLSRWVEPSELTEDFGGLRYYDHDCWLRNKLATERYVKETTAVLLRLDMTYGTLLSLPDSLSSHVLNCTLKRGEDIVRDSLHTPTGTLRSGEKLIAQLKKDPGTGFTEENIVSECDILTVQRCNGKLLEKVKTFELLWNVKRAKIQQSLKFLQLRKDIETIIEDINHSRDILKNFIEIGMTVEQCDSLRKEHDYLEYCCAEVYARFSVTRKRALILKKGLFSDRIESLIHVLDSTCSSFATDLDNRKEILASSKRFHSVLDEFFKHCDELKQLIEGFPSTEESSKLECILSDATCSRNQLTSLTGGVLSEGLCLSDLIQDYSFEEEIRNLHHMHVCKWLNFVDSLSEDAINQLDFFILRLRYLQQIIRCENGALQSAVWIRELSKVIITTSCHVGNETIEVEQHIREHLRLQKTARDSYDCGRKLLGTALDLRSKSNHSLKPNSRMACQLFFSWQSFLYDAHEKTKRLDLAWKFYTRTKKLLKRTEEIKILLENQLVLYGKIRKRFVARKHKSAWMGITRELQDCVCTFNLVSTLLKVPIGQYSRSDQDKADVPNIPEGLSQNLSEAQAAVSNVQRSYFEDEGGDPASSISDFRSAASNTTWKSTSISGVEDWCSVTSNGTTIDDWKSVDDDMPEEWVDDEDSSENSGKAIKGPSVMPQDESMQSSETLAEAALVPMEPTSALTYVQETHKEETEFIPMEEKPDISFPDTLQEVTGSFVQETPQKETEAEVDLLMTTVQDSSTIEASTNSTKVFQSTGENSVLPSEKKFDESLGEESKKVTEPMESIICDSQVEEAEVLPMDMKVSRTFVQETRGGIIGEPSDSNLSKTIAKETQKKETLVTETCSKEQFRFGTTSLVKSTTQIQTTTTDDVQTKSIREQRTITPGTSSGQKPIEQIIKVEVQSHSSPKVETSQSYLERTNKIDVKPTVPPTAIKTEVITTTLPKLSPKDQTFQPSKVSDTIPIQAPSKDDDVLARLEAMKSKYHTKTFVPQHELTEGFAVAQSFPEKQKDWTEISKISYSKESTETRTMTKVFYEQQSLGARQLEASETKQEQTSEVMTPSSKFDVSCPEAWINVEMPLQDRLKLVRYF